MAKVLNINDFVNQNVGKGLNDLINQLSSVNKEFDKVIKTTTDLNTQFQKNNTTQQQTSKNVKSVNDTTKQLTTTQKELQKVLQQTTQVRAKAAAESTKEGKQLAALKVRRQENNKLIRSEAKFLQGLKLSRAELTALIQKNQMAYNRLVAQQKQTTAQGQRLAANLKEQKAALQQLNATSGRSGGLFKGLTGALKSTVATTLGWLAAIGLVVKTIGSAVKTVINFDKSVAELAGILGQTRDEITPLIDSAKELGSTTAKSASEVIKLQQSYARLGFTQQEIIDLTKGTIAGSIALNAELDETADLTGAVVNSFDDFAAADAGKILDTLTLSTQKSATNFQFLSTALPIAAGAANGAGVSFEVLVDQLGQAADRGIDASTAATSLRNVYLALSEQGLTLDQALNKINSSQDRLSTANELFGKRAAVTALALASNAGEATKFAEALGDVAGTAQKVADQQLDTLQGDITLLKSAWEGFILGLEDGEGVFAKVFRKIIQSITSLLTGVTQFRNDFVENFNDLIKSSKVFRVAVAVLGNAVRLNFKLMLESIKLVVQPFIGLGKIVGNLLRGEFDQLGQTARATFSGIGERIKSIGNLVVDAGINIVEAFKGDNLDQFLLGQKKAVELTTQSTNAIKENTKAVVENDQAKEKTISTLDRQRLAEAKNNLLILKDTEKTQEEKERLIQESAMRLLQFEINNIQKVLQTENLKNAKRFELEQQLVNKKIELQVQLNAAQAALEEAQTEKLAEEAEKRQEIINQTATATQDIGNALFEFASVQREQEFAALEEQQARELEAAGDNEQAREKILEKFDKKRKQLQRAQARQDKTQALFNAAINTAVAVTKALPNPVLAGVAAALGAIQIATILAKPLPQFAKGVENFSGGHAIVGEKGTELGVLPTGKAFLTPAEPTLMNLPAGTDIYPHIDPATQAVLQGGISEEKYKDLIESNKRIERAILSRPEKSTTITSDGIDFMYRSANSKTKHEDVYYRR